MPNRYIREDAIESEAVNGLSWQAEVFWRRLLNRVDDFGRFSAHRELLRASVFPLQLDKVSSPDVGKLLLECEQAGLVRTWKTANGKEFLALTKWERGRATTSKYPDPPPDIQESLESKEYLGTGVHMGAKMGGLGTVGDSRGQLSPDRGQPRSTPTPTPTPIPTHTPTPPPTPREGASARPANVEEVIGVGAVCGVSEQDCRDWHRDMEACGWAKVDGTPFGNWKRELTIHRDRLRERQARQSGTAKPPTGERKEIQEKIQIRKVVLSGNQ